MNHARPLLLPLVLLLIVAAPQFLSAQDSPAKLKIFILAGQSNMEGKGSVETMTRQLADPEKRSRFAHLQEGDQWVIRSEGRGTLRTQEVFVLQGALVDVSGAEAQLDEKPARQAGPAPEFQHRAVDVLVLQLRAGIAQQRIRC